MGEIVPFRFQPRSEIRLAATGGDAFYYCGCDPTIDPRCYQEQSAPIVMLLAFYSDDDDPLPDGKVRVTTDCYRC